MSNEHTAGSIVRYGDNENARRDFKTLEDNLARQGSDFVLTAIAEHIGQCNLRWKLSRDELARVKHSLTEYLIEAINKRT